MTTDAQDGRVTEAMVEAAQLEYRRWTIGVDRSAPAHEQYRVMRLRHGEPAEVVSRHLLMSEAEEARRQREWPAALLAAEAVRPAEDAEVERLRRELDEARAVIRTMDAARIEHSDDCPCCKAYEDQDHAPGCTLAAALPATVDHTHPLTGDTWRQDPETGRIVETVQPDPPPPTAREIRAAALEEAAKVADGYGQTKAGPLDDFRQGTGAAGRAIAAAIRGIKETGHGRG